MKPCKIKGTEWLNTTSEKVIASVVIGERNSLEKSSKGAFCEGTDWWVASLKLTFSGLQNFLGSYKRCFQNLKQICLRFVKIPVECPTLKFECLDVESLVIEETWRWLPLFRAVGEFCSPYAGAVCVARRCNFFVIYWIKNPVNMASYSIVLKTAFMTFITRKLSYTPGCTLVFDEIADPGSDEWTAHSISCYNLWPFVAFVEKSDAEQGSAVPCSS